MQYTLDWLVALWEWLDVTSLQRKVMGALMASIGILILIALWVGKYVGPSAKEPGSKSIDELKKEEPKKEEQCTLPQK